MAKVSVNEDFAASADEVWQKLSDFGGLAGWMPGVEKCDVTGEGVGAVRTVAMGPMKVVERLDVLDPDARTLSYALTEGPMPLDGFVGTIAVHELGSGCRVDWSARFELPDGLTEEQIAPGIAGGYSGALAALKRQLGG